MWVGDSSRKTSHRRSHSSVDPGSDRVNETQLQLRQVVPFGAGLRGWAQVGGQSVSGTDKPRG